MSRDYIDESNVDVYWEELMEEGQTTCPECERVYAPKHWDGCPGCWGRKSVDENY